MIAIQTKYLPPTNTRGARIKAWVQDGQSVIVPYDYSLSGVHVHFAAVEELGKRCGLDVEAREMRYGVTERGYVFCFSRSVLFPAGYGDLDDE